MKKLILSISLALLGTNSIAGVTYTYKKSDGTVIFTNKKMNDSSMHLIDARLSPPALVVSAAQYKYETDYKNWVKGGKSTPPLLTPRKVSKEIGFTGYILFSVYSGKGLISSTPYNTGYTYDSYEDCMDLKDTLLYEFKKSGQGKLNPDYVYPQNTQKTYQYKCISEVSNIERAIFSKSTLQKWEKEALAEKQEQELRVKKDFQDYEQAKREIELNKNKIQPKQEKADISKNQIKDESATRSLEKLIIDITMNQPKNEPVIRQLEKVKSVPVKDISD